jgi:hypothetical protein
MVTVRCIMWLLILFDSLLTKYRSKSNPCRLRKTQVRDQLLLFHSDYIEYETKKNKLQLLKK